MTTKSQKTTDEQDGPQDPNAASTDMSMEQMFLAMMQKQQEIERLMLKMMSGQQALERELEQQKKKLEKEQEERKKDEDWLKGVEFPKIPDEERDKVEEHLKQAPRMVGVKRNAEVLIQEERAT